MPRTGALNFFASDIYPGGSNGYYGTTELSLPDAGDQMALVDDEQLAKNNPADVDAGKHKTIFFTIAAIIAIIVLFSLK